MHFRSAPSSEKSLDSCSETCTCSTREEEKIKENIPGMFKFLALKFIVTKFLFHFYEIPVCLPPMLHHSLLNCIKPF